jgi:lipopolysaccharide export system protein LptA
MSVASRRWIRRLSAAGIVLLLLTLGGFIADRLRLLQTPIEELDGDQISNGDGDRAVGIYTGFEFVERVAGREIFRLLSKRTLGLSSGWHEIEGVRLQFYRDGEPGPVLTCDGARFNIQTRDAELAGSVRLELPSGASLTTDAGSFSASSRVFRAGAEVRFVSGATFGRAGSASYDLERDEIVLDGGTTLHTGDGASLSAPLTVYERARGRVAFPEGAELRFADTRIEAPAMAADLEPGDGPPRRIEMSGGVEARSLSPDGGGQIEAWMERVVAVRDGAGRWQVYATTTGPWVRVLFVGGEGYFERELESWILRAALGAEGLVNLRAEGGVCIREVPTEGAVRLGESVAARVWFADGSATDVELLRDVRVRSEGVEARGHRARMAPQAGLVMLHGDPAGPERVLLTSERGRLSCDQAQLFNREGRSEARGNVQGEIRDVSLVGGDDRVGGEPAHLASDTLEVTREGTVYHLSGSARLWQGHRLLLADDVVLDHGDQVSLRASGHVRTTFPATEFGVEGDPGADVVVVARSLDYDQAAASAIYRGNVRYSDPEHTLAAAELSVFFDAEDEISAVEAVGAVEIVILDSGRRMTGQHARRETATQLVTVTGSPVRITDPRGNEVSGSSLTWNQADGTVSVAGGTETIYFPEDRP